MLAQPTVHQEAESELDQFRDEVAAFLAAHYPPMPNRRDRGFVWGEGSDEFPGFIEPTNAEAQANIASVKEWRRVLFDAGLAWITGPKSYGGQERPPIYQRSFDAVARKFDVPGNGLLRVSLGMVAPTILAHGTQQLGEQYLVALQRADLIGCQLFSEPGAGSDLASVATSARRDGDDWIVDGQKVWVSGAHLSDVGLLLCRTAPGPRHRNLTMFLLDMHSPGVHVRPLVQMTGAANFNEVFLTDVRVSDGNRLGEVDTGWQVAMTTLLNERDAIGGSGLGGSGVLSTDRLKALVQHVGVNDDPLIRQEFATLVIELKIAGYMRLRAQARRRSGGPPGPEMSLAKLALGRNMARLSHFVGQVLGPRLIADSGEWGTYRWTDVVLSAPGMRIGGGTDEVQKNVIGERLLGLPKEPPATEEPTCASG